LSSASANSLGSPRRTVAAPGLALGLAGGAYGAGLLGPGVGGLTAGEACVPGKQPPPYSPPEQSTELLHAPNANTHKATHAATIDGLSNSAGRLRQRAGNSWVSGPTSTEHPTATGLAKAAGPGALNARKSDFALRDVVKKNVGLAHSRASLGSEWKRYGFGGFLGLSEVAVT
jgi:hypothetical protein